MGVQSAHGLIKKKEKKTDPTLSCFENYQCEMVQLKIIYNKKNNIACIYVFSWVFHEYILFNCLCGKLLWVYLCSVNSHVTEFYAVL